MTTSSYLVAAYLGSVALYGGYLVHLVRRRRALGLALGHDARTPADVSR
jgi:hypothetical protein